MFVPEASETPRAGDESLKVFGVNSGPADNNVSPVLERNAVGDRIGEEYLNWHRFPYAAIAAVALQIRPYKPRDSLSTKPFCSRRFMAPFTDDRDKPMICSSSVIRWGPLESNSKIS